MHSEFNTQKVGQCISKLQKHRNIKAAEVAKYLKITEQAYTKYERGQTAISLTLLGKVGQFFNVNPLHFLQYSPENVVEKIYNSTVPINNNAIHNNHEELIVILKQQIAEKDKQLEQQLLLISKIIQPK